METIELKKNSSVKRVIDNAEKKLNVINCFFTDDVVTYKKTEYKVESDDVAQLKEGISLVEDIPLQTLCKLSVTNGTRAKVSRQIRDETE